MESRTISLSFTTLLALATLTGFGCRPDADRTCEQLTADKIPFPADWATPEFMESQANAYILCLPDNVAEDSELIDSLVCTLLPEHLAEIPVFFLSLYRESHITNIDRLSTDFYGTYDHIEKDLLYIYMNGTMVNSNTE
jgi:hypothetical protein